jgi:hypothetical protein
MDEGDATTICNLFYQINDEKIAANLRANHSHQQDSPAEFDNNLEISRHPSQTKYHPLVKNLSFSALIRELGQKTNQ